MSVGWHHLTWDDRIRIESLLKAHQSVAFIADDLGVTEQTIYNELSRGRYQKKVGYTDAYGYERLYKYVDCYSPDIAQQKYEEELKAKGTDIKLGCDYAFADFVEDMILNKHYSPEATLKYIESNNLTFDTKICTRTLYKWIYAGVFAHLSEKNLMFKGKRQPIKKYKKKKFRSRDCAGISIEKRPSEIESRSEFGHWEMDCVCGSSKTCLLTLVERKTRFLIVMKIPDQKAFSVVSALNKLEHKYGKKFKSIFRSVTVDNGSEFSDFLGMRKSIYNKKSYRSVFYFSHPYSAYERGTNERLNREVRRWIPKGSDLSKYSDSDVASVMDWVNDYPRGVLGFASSRSMFESELSFL